MTTKFLVLRIDSNINKHNHTERKICKLSGAYYAVRSMVHVGNTNTFKSSYISYSESKYRLHTSLAHSRNCHFAHVQ